jgi:hypothetical protein
MKERFSLKKSNTRNLWLLTDHENQILIRFEQHRFNDTQEVVYLDEESEKIPQDKLNQIMREFGNWMYNNAYYIGMPLDDTRAFCAHILSKAMNEEGFDTLDLSAMSGFRERNIQKILNGEFALKVTDLVRLLSAMGKRIVIK